MGGATVAEFLVVEDDPDVRRTLGRVVRPYGEAALVASVREARRALEAQQSWRGFVIDLGLPDGSGLDVLTAARVTCPDTPAVVLTGSTEGAAINAAFDLGAAYLVKPFANARLCRFLETTSRVGGADKERSDPIPETIQGCVERLRLLFSCRQDVPTRYAIGATISAIKASPHLFGSGAILTVARALDEDLPTLYRHAAVAEQWTASEMDALVVRKGRDGRSLSWSHLAILGPVADPTARATLVTRTLDEGLSVRELTDIVTKVAGAPDAPGGLGG